MAEYAVRELSAKSSNLRPSELSNALKGDTMKWMSLVSILLAVMFVAAACLLVSCDNHPGSPSLSSERHWEGNSATPVPPDPIAKPSPTPPTPPTLVVGPAVKAGWADDNAQYNYYLGYLEEFGNVSAFKIDITGRIVFTVLDEQGKSLPNCQLTIQTPDGAPICKRSTYADGKAMFFPREMATPKAVPQHLVARAKWGEFTKIQEFDLAGPQAIEMRLATNRPAMEKVPLDIAFVLDTTSSMDDEIDSLKKTLQAIHYQVTEMSPKPDVRFGMVLYRDRGDQYVTRTTAFTSDFDAFDKALKTVAAAGGGDTPEDVQQALRVAVTELKWRPEAVKMVFLLGDAPPHLDYKDEKFTYVDYARQAAEMGIKTTAIGASGLDNQGEYIWRQLAQYTRGLFVFLTYGEKGDSGPGKPSKVSHHTGDNWQARNLDAIIVKTIARELSYLGDKPAQAAEDFFEAHAGSDASNRDVLEDLYNQCVRQLVDYSQVRMAKGTSVAVVPVKEDNPELSKATSAATEQLNLAFARQKHFKLVERQDLKEILDEHDLAKALNLDRKDPTSAPAKPLAAEVLVISRTKTSGDVCEVFVKMVRVQTGEVVSATMMKVDKTLLSN